MTTARQQRRVRVLVSEPTYEDLLGQIADLRQHVADRLDDLADAARRIQQRQQAESAGADWLTAGEAAAIVKVDESTIRRWVHGGQLRGQRIGRTVRVRRVDLERRVH